jgi:hypothetical protein
MALNDNAVLTAAIGYIYTAPVGTAAPTVAQLSALDPLAPASWTATGWDLVGHTSRDDLPEFGYDGGDSEVKGSWQKKKLREVVTNDPEDFLTFKLEQFDANALNLYYGTNTSAVAGEYGVSATDFSPVARALLVIIVDGSFRIGFHAFKASIKRDDSISLATDDLGTLPVKAKFLQYNTNALFKWINIAVAALPTLKLGGATAGTFTLKVGSNVSGAITVSGISATTIKTALAAIDDGISAAQITVTASGADYTIDIPATVSLGTDSTTGGTGVSVV